MPPVTVMGYSCALFKKDTEKIVNFNCNRPTFQKKKKNSTLNSIQIWDLSLDTRKT